MSLDKPTFLAELFANIRTRPIAWDAAARAHLVSDADVKRIKAVDKVPKERRVAIVEKDAEAYAKLVLWEDGVLQKSVAGKRMDIVQYMLVLTGDLLQGESFFRAAASRTNKAEFIGARCRQLCEFAHGTASAVYATTIVAQNR